MLGFDLEVVTKFTVLFWSITGLFCLSFYGICLVLKVIFKSGSIYTPDKPTPAPMPFVRGNKIGNPPSPIHQNRRPIPPNKK